MMKDKLFPMGWAAALILLTGCQQEMVTEVATKAAFQEPEQESIYVAGTANILLDEETVQWIESGMPETRAAASFNNAVGEIGMNRLERIFPDAGEFEQRSREMGLHRWYRIHFSPSVEKNQARDILRQVDGIKAFEPVVKAKKMNYPFNDPQFGSQWQYRNDGSKTDWVAGADMQVIPVWRYFTTGDPAVSVAVVDGGVQLNHEDLAGNIDATNSHNFVNDSDYVTPNDHGTHVAGTIAAVNNNGLGVVGLAGGDAAEGKKGVRVMSCQVFSDNGSGGFEAAIKWAADHGAVLCNNSWGYDFGNEDGTFRDEEARETHEFFLQPNTGEYASALKSAIDYFNKYAGVDASGKQTGPMAGAVCLFSAGNDGKPWGSPACYSGVVAVGAIGPQGGRAYYSNYGDWVDISATGGDANYSQILSTVINNGYGSYQGTSMSCPHATGVAALLVSYFGGPGFTREMLLERLLKAKSPTLVLDVQQIGVMMDAMASFTYGEDLTPAKVTDLSATAKSNTVTASWSVTGSGKIPAAGYYLFSGTDKDAVMGSTPDKTGKGVRRTTVISTPYEVGETVSQSIQGLSFETPYWFKVIGFDKQPSFSEESEMYSVTTPANNPPVITPSESTEGLAIRSFESKTLSFVVTDPDDHTFTLEITPGSDAETWYDTSAGKTVRIDGNKVDAGTYHALITATDRYKASSTYTLTYRILPNNPPVAVKDISDMILSGQGEPVELSVAEYFNDPDGETLTYSAVNTSPAVLHATVNAGVLHITPIGFGASSVTVTAQDARGENVSITFRVLVRKPGVEYQAYPNPVSDFLYIATGLNEESTDIKVVSATGATLWEGTVNTSAFDPAKVDFSTYAPGQYGLFLKFGGKEYYETIVKR